MVSFGRSEAQALQMPGWLLVYLLSWSALALQSVWRVIKQSLRCASDVSDLESEISTCSRSGFSGLQRLAFLGRDEAMNSLADCVARLRLLASALQEPGRWFSSEQGRI